MAIAIQIGEAQYQKFKRIALYLHRLSFPHGQLYVTFRRSCLFGNAAVTVTEGHRQTTENDDNTVYQKVLRNYMYVYIYIYIDMGMSYTRVSHIKVAYRVPHK
jgi:hypothetical protein